MTYNPHYFTAATSFYQKNTTDAARVRADPGWLTNMSGEKEPAVVIFDKSQPIYVMPIGKALYLANQIANAIEAIKQAESESAS